MAQKQLGAAPQNPEDAVTKAYVRNQATDTGWALHTAADAAAARASIGAVSDSDSRLNDNRTPTDGSVTAAKLESSFASTIVPSTRTINTHPLSSNITLTQDDIGDGTTNKAFTASDKTRLANTSGTNTGDQTNISGNAATATALGTGRTVQANLASGTAATFDGTANITPGVTGTLPVANGGTGATTLTGIVKGSGTAAFSAAVSGTDYADPSIDSMWEPLTTGQSTIPRRLVSASMPSGSGTIRLTYFTARKTETITQVRTCTAGVAAAGGTLCRIGIYTIDASGNLTLAASTASDTNLWTSTSTAYTKSLSASYGIVRGTRYAVALLFVGTTTSPQFMGCGGIGAGSEFGLSPRLSGFYSGRTDLDASISAASIADSAAQYYAVLLP